MQVQKHLFKIAERVNTAPSAQICWKFIYFLCVSLATIFLALFLVGEFIIDNNFNDFRTCLAKTNFSMTNDEIAFVFENKGLLEAIIEKNYQSEQKNSQTSKEDKSQLPDKKSILYRNSDTCTIYKNVNITSITPEIFIANSLSFSFGKPITSFDVQARKDFLVDNYTIVFNDPPNKLTRFLYTYYVMLSREMVQLKDEQIMKMSYRGQNNQMIETSNFPLYSKISNSYEIFKYYGISEQKAQETESVIHHLKQFIEIVFVYALTSIVTAFYIYVTIIASPAVILLILSCTPYGRGQQFNQAHKAFPWIGMHTLILKSANHRTVRDNFDQMCIGLIYYFFFLYLAYYMTILLLSNGFFDMPSEQGVPEIFFGYIAILEFCALIFMRTRPFLKYFPVCHTIMVMLFLLYCKQSHYGYKLFLVAFLQMLGSALFSWMMVKLEIPAQRTWDRNINYVPSINQPRAGLMPAFNLNWINGLPEQWAMLFPLESRRKFSQQELSFVDRNYQMVNQYLSQRN